MRHETMRDDVHSSRPKYNNNNNHNNNDKSTQTRVSSNMWRCPAKYIHCVLCRVCASGRPVCPIGLSPSDIIDTPSAGKSASLRVLFAVDFGQTNKYMFARKTYTPKHTWLKVLVKTRENRNERIVLGLLNNKAEESERGELHMDNRLD